MKTEAGCSRLARGQRDEEEAVQVMRKSNSEVRGKSETWAVLEAR